MIRVRTLARTLIVALAVIAAVALPGVAGAQTAGNIPWLTDPTFTVAPSRLAPGDVATIRMSRDWPTTKAPCTAAGSGEIAVVLAQGSHVFVWPLQPLAHRTFTIAIPSAEQLRVAGIRRSGRASLTALVHGCAKRHTFFGRDQVTLALPRS